MCVYVLLVAYNKEVKQKNFTLRKEGELSLFLGASVLAQEIVRGLNCTRRTIARLGECFCHTNLMANHSWSGRPSYSPAVVCHGMLYSQKNQDLWKCFLLVNLLIVSALSHKYRTKLTLEKKKRSAHVENIFTFCAMTSHTRFTKITSNEGGDATSTYTATIYRSFGRSFFHLLICDAKKNNPQNNLASGHVTNTIFFLPNPNFFFTSWPKKKKKVVEQMI